MPVMCSFWCSSLLLSSSIVLLVVVVVDESLPIDGTLEVSLYPHKICTQFSWLSSVLKTRNSRIFIGLDSQITDELPETKMVAIMLPMKTTTNIYPTKRKLTRVQQYPGLGCSRSLRIANSMFWHHLPNKEDDEKKLQQPMTRKERDGKCFTVESFRCCYKKKSKHTQKINLQSRQVTHQPTKEYSYNYQQSWDMYTL